MRTVHVGLAASSEENADRFFRDLLGLKKEEPKTISQQVSKAVFGIAEDLRVVNYTGNGSHFEVFIHGTGVRKNGAAEHVCVEIDELDKFLEKSRSMNVQILRVPKGDAILSFVYDLDGNCFELKQKKTP
jgi:catechol 2,3-dioxygenase-like lactoylglutathione lyase family enzyme